MLFWIFVSEQNATTKAINNKDIQESIWKRRLEEEDALVKKKLEGTNNVYTDFVLLVAAVVDSFCSFRAVQKANGLSLIHI